MSWLAFLLGDIFALVAEKHIAAGAAVTQPPDYEVGRRRVTLSNPS